MAVVNTNVSATIAQNALMKNEREMNTAMERLSTGSRINGAKDDAAGLAISSRMTSQIRGLDMGIRNANDAISMLQTADGAMIEVTNMLQRMRELAIQASNGTTTEDDRNYLNAEYANLISEMERIANNTQWNGRSILQGDANAAGDSTVKFQVGANGGQTVAVDFGDISQSGGATFQALVPQQPPPPYPLRLLHQPSRLAPQQSMRSTALLPRLTPNAPPSVRPLTS